LTAFWAGSETAPGVTKASFFSAHAGLRLILITPHLEQGDRLRKAIVPGAANRQELNRQDRFADQSRARAGVDWIKRE
jgi:hypothetical protein